ncbi:DNA cytosine methyltransferase [Nocardia cyriacigeorgica]|uniref:DNA cytosine methyltransferase n=1 Tax=Nocardia cyriacigeorgica TaxID=135487 RepID=UPI00189356B4|nr:DNA (cytosine-5-)-methyltransferase [Nocardia cyriacigeorgica]MBF6397904.1 DNA cytosine methyltransferase [Nocardia cyriacigeorgica]MBF6402439.1 DNA cytosine methyltransferase [Nocardia cyriacigeorgica]
MPSFYEFFAGGGMAHAGLGDRWDCVFANDIDAKKAESYRANWGGEHLVVGDVAQLSVADLPAEQVDLAWASFPCQDLSLAGAGAGLSGARSGTFHPFWKLMKALNAEARAPRLVVLENVVGALTAGQKDERTGKSDGRDFVELGRILAKEHYRFGAVVVDAVHWVPQSRPRLFILAVADSLAIPDELIAEGPNDQWHPSALKAAHRRLTDRVEAAAAKWIWWKLPDPPISRVRFDTLEQLVEQGDPDGVEWHSPAETQRILDLMSPANLKKVQQAQASTETCGRKVGTVYKRMRPEGDLIEVNGRTRRKNVQRAEVRFDDIAGCLRTPTGGSSRQTILVVEPDRIRSRLLSPLEAIRLMGLADSYQRIGSYNDVYHLAGDGVVVPVVDFLARSVLEPVLAHQPAASAAVREAKLTA